MPDNIEYIIRQAQLFHQIEDFIKSVENGENDYGFNIPLEMDIILSIYHEVNNDMRNKSDLKLKSDLIYSRTSHHHKNKK